MAPKALLRFLSVSTLVFSTFAVVSAGTHARHAATSRLKAERDPWSTLPFTAREWARQTLLPYRRIPLKHGGTISVQKAYDLYLQAGQPDYPDMSTPGLVTAAEIEHQMKLSGKYKG